jgi:hypothetical protein
MYDPRDLEDGANLHFFFIIYYFFFFVFERKEILGVLRFFHALYLWSVAFLSPLSIRFADFLVRFSLPK